MIKSIVKPSAHCLCIIMPPYRHHCLPLPPYILFPIYILCNNKRHSSLRRPCLYFLTDWICRLSTSLPSKNEHRQYDNRKRTDTYYPVSVICPVHLLFVFHTLQTLFQLVIGFTFHALLLSFHAYKPSSFYNSSLSFFRKSFRVISQNFPVLFD